MNSNLLVRPPLTVLHLPEISPPSITVFKYQSLCVLVTPSCPTLCDHMDCSLPNFSVLGISPARILEWIAFSFPRGSGSLQICWTAFTSQAPSGDCPGYLQKQSASLPKSEQPVFSILNLGIKRQSCCKQSTGVSTALKASRGGAQLSTAWDRES